MESSRQGGGANWTIVFQLLGASAALAGFVAFVGAAILWARFHALHLPADQAVAVLPRSLLITVGAHSLAAPILAGLAAVLLVFLIDPFDDSDGPRTHLWVVLIALSLIALGVVIGYVADYDVWPYQVVMYAALPIALVAALRVAHRPGFRPLGWTLFAVFAFLGGLLAFVQTTAAPKLEPAAVLLQGKAIGVSGFYLGQTSDRLYVAPLPGSGDPSDPFADADIDRILEIPRDQVVKLAIRDPAGIRADEAGRDQAQSLLAELRQQQTAGKPVRPEVVTTADPVTAFAPLVHLHSKETAWPMNVSEFLDNSWLMWAHAGRCPDYVVTLGRHVGDRDAIRTQIMGRFERERLGGPPGYTHVPADGRRCRDLKGPAYATTDHTRPYDPKGRPAELPEKDGFYLDLWDKKRNGDPNLDQEGAQTAFTGVPVYFERHPEQADGHRGERITYWLFYGLSQPPGPRSATAHFVHEADWERVSVLIRPGARSGEWIPVSVRYHAHDGHRDVPWFAVQKVAAGQGSLTHPVTYSARGSHADYPRAGRYENAFKVGTKRILTVHDQAIACSRCPEWSTWRLLYDARNQAWYGFGGAWGQAGGMAGTTGPLGPSRYKLGGLQKVAEKPVLTVQKPPPG